MARPLGLALLAAALAACGYHPAQSLRGQVEVAAVALRAPAPDVAACLATELRLALGATGRPRRRSPPGYRLEVEVVSAAASPGALASGPDGPRPVDQEVSLVMLARLVRREGGTVWGPERYRLSRRALEGPGAASSHAAAGQALEEACAEAARRVVDDLDLAVLEPGEEGRD